MTVLDLIRSFNKYAKTHEGRWPTVCPLWSEDFVQVSIEICARAPGNLVWIGPDESMSSDHPEALPAIVFGGVQIIPVSHE